MEQGRDANGDFHGDDGRYVSVGTLFERERLSHSKDHEQERQVARETAQRLEREVEQTAQRLERVVEETAVRIESGVRTALTAVTDTARVHSEAHDREHKGHERIHEVEKEQVDKAERDRRERDLVLAESLAEYKKQNNEWSGTVRNLTSNFPQRLELDAKFSAVEKELRVLAQLIADLREDALKDRGQFLRLDVYDQRHAALADRVTALQQQSIKDGEMHASTVPAFRIVQSAVDELEDKVGALEGAAARAKEAEDKVERNRKWLIGVTAAAAIAVLGMVVNIVINLTQGVP